MVKSCYTELVYLQPVLITGDDKLLVPAARSHLSHGTLYKSWSATDCNLVTLVEPLYLNFNRSCRCLPKPPYFKQASFFIASCLLSRFN